MDDLDALFGIEADDPIEMLAAELVEEDERLMSELIRLRRASLTQQEVADRLGISRPAVAAFERFDSDPRLSTVRRYALAIRAAVKHSVETFDASRARTDQAFLEHDAAEIVAHPRSEHKELVQAYMRRLVSSSARGAV